jgi:hypothetical protein
MYLICIALKIFIDVFTPSAYVIKINTYEK